MRKLSRGLALSLEESGVINHALSKGELRENEVHNAFRPHIPRRFGLSSGLVVNAAGEQSKQQDLIISDEQKAPPFIASGGIGVHPIETVHGVVEIKSKATLENVRDGVAKGLSVAKLLPTGPRQRPVGWPADTPFEVRSDKPFAGILCLSGAASLESVATAFLEANSSLDRADRTYSLVVLGQGLLAWMNSARQLTGPIDAKQLLIIEYGDDALMYFYSGLLRGIWQYVPPPFGLIDYTVAAAETGPAFKVTHIPLD